LVYRPYSSACLSLSSIKFDMTIFISPEDWRKRTDSRESRHQP
jgi:hypothetical protein